MSHLNKLYTTIPRRFRRLYRTPFTQGLVVRHDRCERYNLPFKAFYSKFHGDYCPRCTRPAYYTDEPIVLSRNDFRGSEIDLEWTETIRCKCGMVFNIRNGNS